MTGSIVMPRAPVVVAEAIPPELRAMRNWLTWKYEPPKKPGAKPRKVPYWIGRGRRHGLQGTPGDRAGMGTFEEALVEYQAKDRAGIGFAPFEGDGIIALDFDDCIDQAGNVEPDLLELLVGTYAEVSPSGRGLRAFYRGHQSELGNRKPDSRRVEIFQDRGYVTVTGNALPGAPATVAELPGHVAEFLAAQFERRGEVATGNVAPRGWPLEQIRECLEVLPDDLDYDTWLMGGMAIHHETRGSKHGFEIWYQNNRQSPKHTSRAYDWARWVSFGKPRRDGRPQVTIATLHRLAGQYGAHVPLDPPANDDDFEDVAAQQAEAREQLDALLESWQIVCAGPDEAIEDIRRLAEQAALASAEVGELIARVSSATEQPEEAVAQALGVQLPRYASLIDLHTDPPPARQWVVRGWIPLGQVTLLSGAGGIGKTLLAQQLGTCIASGTAALGEPVEPGPVLGFLCEDDNDEIRRRQIQILEHYRMEAGVVAERLFLEGRSGRVSTLVTFGSDRRMHRGEFCKIVEGECRRLRPLLLILDNIAHLFNGNANDAHEVTAFVNMLTAIAVPLQCAVLLVGHVRKAGAAGEATDFLGSVAWENTVRSRMLLSRRADGLLELKRAKANYAGRESLLLEYRAGALVELGEADDEGPAILAAAEAIVLEALRDFTAREINVSHHPTARNNLVKQAESEGLLEGTSPTAARQALSRLIRSGRVIPNAALPWRTADRKPARGLAIAEKAQDESGDPGIV